MHGYFYRQCVQPVTGLKYSNDTTVVSVKKPGTLRQFRDEIC